MSPIAIQTFTFISFFRSMQIRILSSSPLQVCRWVETYFRESQFEYMNKITHLNCPDVSRSYRPVHTQSVCTFFFVIPHYRSRLIREHLRGNAIVKEVFCCKASVPLQWLEIIQENIMVSGHRWTSCGIPRVSTVSRLTYIHEDLDVPPLMIYTFLNFLLSDFTGVSLSFMIWWGTTGHRPCLLGFFTEISRLFPVVFWGPSPNFSVPDVQKNNFVNYLSISIAFPLYVGVRRVDIASVLRDASTPWRPVFRMHAKHLTSVVRVFLSC